MRYLLDTNVVSELRKGDHCNLAVTSWEQAELVPHRGAISVLTLGEIRKGIALISQRDPRQVASLELWLQGLCQEYADRILPITREVADQWGRINAKRSLPAVDSLLAATAIVNNLILATRNVRDLQDVGVHVVNPFTYSRH